MKKMLLCAVLALFICGCVTAPTPEELDSADYGARPIHYETITKEFLSNVLKDPDSAKYDIKEPCKGYYTDPPAVALMGQKRETKYGWIVDVWVNAKNSYGGYTGYKKYSFLFRGEVDFDLISIPYE